MVKKPRSLMVIDQEWANCTRCELHESRRPEEHVCAVPQKKIPDFPAKKLLWVTDSPLGGDGYLGQLFSSDKETDVFYQVCESANINPDHVLVTSIVGCIPRISPTEDTEVKPKAEHRKKCVPRVLDIIRTVDPYVLLVSGQLAFGYLVPTKSKGTSRTYKSAVSKSDTYRSIPIGPCKVTYPIVPIYSPNDILTYPTKAARGPFSETIRQLGTVSVLLDFLYD